MQFELDEILTVIDKVKSAELSSFEYEDSEVKIKIKGPKTAVSAAKEISPACSDREKKKSVPAVGEAQESGENIVYITSPMVGIFYAAPKEGAEPFVQKKEEITSGQVVGIIEAMKLMNEVEADCEGIIEEVLVQNEQMVEFGQPLFKVRLKEEER